MPAQYARYPSLVDRTVFITGGADGIGSALVEQCARQRSRVAFVDKNAAYAQATIQRCTDAGVAHAPLFYEIDLLDIDALNLSCWHLFPDFLSYSARSLSPCDLTMAAVRAHMNA